MSIKKDELLLFFTEHIFTCNHLLEKYNDYADFEKFEMHELKLFCFLQEFFVDYCEKNNIEEFDF